jgi:DNA-binding response OmpR family regulator
VAHVLMLTRRSGDVLPSLDLLDHRVTRLPADTGSLPQAGEAELVVIDGVVELAAAKSLCRIVEQTLRTPVLLVLGEGGLAAVQLDWGIADVVLDAAGPAEVDARIRLCLAGSAPRDQPIVAAGLRIDEASYQASINGKPLDLTYKEFELLRFLASHPVRVFTREQLLSEVWGYDYFGGTRTVDVHVRRLRAKLGDLESAIGTVRNVGYRFEVAHD